MTALELPERQDWTVDDLVDLPADLDYELINGRLVVPSPTPAHQILAGEVWLAVRANCPPDYLVSLDQSLQVDRRNEPRPDVVVVRIEHIDRTPVPVEDAVLAIEVVSQHSEFRDMYDKANVYAKAGIVRYWVIEQPSGDVSLTEMTHDREAGLYRTGAFTTEVFRVTEPWEITIDLRGMSNRLAALRERAKPGE
ncbi:MAG: hypothetical protein V7603_1813 [Micromonosporaceae bacterium]